MTTNHPKLVAIATLLAIALAPAASAKVYLVDEEWDNGLAGWEISGSSAFISSSAGNPSPSLHLDPCCASYVTVSRGIGLTVNVGALVAFDFSGSGTAGDTDSGFEFALDDGTVVAVWVTEGVGTNTGIKLCVDSTCSTFDSWSSAGAWYTVTLRLDALTHTVHAHSSATDATTSLAYPSSAHAISSATFFGIRWTSTGPTTYDYDNLVITGT